jgi:hypothetical protein
MNVPEYHATLADLGLTEEQIRKITDAFGELMKPVQADAYYTRGDAEQKDMHRYFTGKVAGLNVAYKFFAGTLHEADELDE